nr:hypothetical protein Hi04_10k_c2877_00019 [uncultured bacterium]
MTMQIHGSPAMPAVPASLSIDGDGLDGVGPGITPNLAAIIARVSRATDAPSLAAALSGELGFDDIRAFVHFGEESYVRALVYRSEHVELRLLCWRPGQSSSLHGHGESACAFRVMRGMATEVVLGERDRVWAPGSIVEERGARIHQVINRERDPLLTLHAYSPPLPVDAPSATGGDTVVIVGGGFSGIATAYHLLEQGGPRLRVHVVEGGPWLGRGVAYGVESHVFALNVPAQKMSIDPDDPQDFVRFARSEDAPGAFLSRSTYGRYVSSRFGLAVRRSPAKMRVWRDEAVAITSTGVTLRSGLHLDADAVVLATGLVPRMIPARYDPRVMDAWDECALSTLPKRGRILLMGSGLSALDVVGFLEAQGFTGEVTVVSRRGLLPLPHLDPLQHAAPLPEEEVAAAPTELRALLRWGREQVRSVERAGRPWQCAVDAIRPHVTRLYRALSPRDRARFVRHVRPFWDVIRHRAPVGSLARVEAWQKEGRLRRLAGRVRVDHRGGGPLEVVIHRQGEPPLRERFDAMVRCIGPALDVVEGNTPLLRSILDGGLGRLVDGGLGIETAPDGRVVGASGTPSSRLWAIGSVRRACDWESTSVPDISVHARQIARDILAAYAPA